MASDDGDVDAAEAAAADVVVAVVEGAWKGGVTRGDLSKVKASGGEIEAERPREPVDVVVLAVLATSSTSHPVLPRFHLARRFWNQILIYLGDNEVVNDVWG